MHSMVIPIVEFQAQIHKIHKCPTTSSSYLDVRCCLLQPWPKKMHSMEASVVDVQAARVTHMIYCSMIPGINSGLFELSLDS